MYDAFVKQVKGGNLSETIKSLDVMKDKALFHFESHVTYGELRDTQEVQDAKQTMANAFDGVIGILKRELEGLNTQTAREES